MNFLHKHYIKKTMTRKVIYRLEKDNAIAFIYSDGSVIDIFSNYIQGKACEGPYLTLPQQVPQELKKEVSQLKSWRDNHSSTLEEFCKTCLRAAAKINKWFEIFV